MRLAIIQYVLIEHFIRAGATDIDPGPLHMTHSHATLLPLCLLQQNCKINYCEIKFIRNTAASFKISFLKNQCNSVNRDS